MATDPVQRVRAGDHDTVISLDLRRPLRRIADVTPSPNVPYLTALIDWRPDGTQPNSRPGRNIIGRRLDDIVASQEAHTPAHEALDKARARILEYLDNEVDPAVQGVYIVAGGERHVFQAVALGLPVETEVMLSAVPVLTPLAHIAEDNPVYAVLVADQKEAVLTVINQGVATGDLTVEGSGYPRKQQQGGWSQRRYQSRADERIAAFARTVAEETQRAMTEAGIDSLIIAGDEVITTALDEAWHPTMKERVVGHVQLGIDATEAEIIEATLPIAEHAERDREIEAARKLVDGVGGPMAVGGAEQTLLALEEGRVMNLILSEDFHADGWVDPTFPVAGVGAPGGEHPAGGDPKNMVPVAIEEEMLRLALSQDAGVEIVRSIRPIEEMPDDRVPDAGEGPPKTEAAKLLEGIGGVGALLRFAVVDSGEAMPEA